MESASQFILQGATGFPGGAGRVGPPGPSVSTSPHALNFVLLLYNCLRIETLFPWSFLKSTFAKSVSRFSNVAFKSPSLSTHVSQMMNHTETGLFQSFKSICSKCWQSTKQKFFDHPIQGSDRIGWKRVFQRNFLTETEISIMDQGTLSIVIWEESEISKRRFSVSLPNYNSQNFLRQNMILKESNYCLHALIMFGLDYCNVLNEATQGRSSADLKM